MRVWWQRCLFAALINLLLWLTPPPVHFIALLMPGFSGYSIASGRCVKGLQPSIQIGLIMGLTLTSTIMVIGIVAVAVISLIGWKVTQVYLLVVVGVSLAIGSYTTIAAGIGALLATHRETPFPEKDSSG